MCNNCDTSQSYKDDIKPIRVLEVIGGMNRGGAESMIMNLYRNVDKSKVQFDFLVHIKDKGLYDDEIESMGGRIYHMTRFKGYNSWAYYKNCCKFFEKHPEYKVVHGHIGSCAAFYLKAAKKYGAFTIAHSHSAASKAHKAHNAHDFFYRIFSYPTRYVADQLFGCSTEAGISRYGKKAVKSKKYRNFCNAIDLDQFVYSTATREKKRKEFNISDDKLVIAQIGRLTPQKNPPMIYAIFKDIVNADPHAICLWVGTGEEENEYREKINNEGYSDKIVMTGVRSDVPDILQAVDCFLFPSLWEGLPVSVIEAQAAGLPCVIADTISKETEVSDLIEWHSLNESPSLWAERCITLGTNNREKRTSPIQKIRENGYDIKETAKWLTDFYVNHSLRK